MHQRLAAEDLLAEASWEGSLSSSPALARPHAAQAPAHQPRAQESPRWALQWAQSLTDTLGLSQGPSTLAAEGAALGSTGLSASSASWLADTGSNPCDTLGHSPACNAAGLGVAGALAGSGCGAASTLGDTSSCSVAAIA